MDLLDTYKVVISVSGAVDAKGAVVDIPAGSFTWEAIQTFGTVDTFGALTPSDADPTKANAATLAAGVGGAKGYVKATLTLADEITKYYGQTGEIVIGVTEAVSLTLTLGTPELA